MTIAQRGADISATLRGISARVIVYDTLAALAPLRALRCAGNRLQPQRPELLLEASEAWLCCRVPLVEAVPCKGCLGHLLVVALQRPPPLDVAPQEQVKPCHAALER